MNDTTTSPELDLSGYDPAAVRHAEAKITEHCGRWPHPSRREAAHFLRCVHAQLIADDVLSGVAQWPPRLAEYAYLRDLDDHLLRDPEAARDVLARAGCEPVTS